MPRSRRCLRSSSLDDSKPASVFVPFILFFCGSLAIFLSSSVGRTRTFLEHDNFQIAYPTRVLVSTAQRAGIPSLWNHWSHGGVPLNTLFIPFPQSPVVRAVGLFGIYDPTLFAAEIGIYFFLCFLGMFLWLRFYGTPLMAIIGASAYSLSSYFIFQAPINVEGMAGPCLYPLLLWGFRLCLMGREGGVAAAVVAAWIMMTTGYLGTNAVAIPLLALFSLGEWHLRGRNKNAPLFAQIRRPLIYLALSAALIAALLSFPIAESYSFFRFDFGQIRESGFDPLTASASIQSLGTLAFPNLASPFVPDSFNGHIGYMFTGIISLFFIAFGLRAGSERALKRCLLVFSILVFCINQSDQFGLGAVSMRLVPFLSRVRFHVWNLIMVPLFLIPLAVLGLQDFFDPKISLARLRKESTRAALATVLVSAASFLLLRTHPAYVHDRVFQCGQIYVFLLFLAALPFIFSLRSRRPQIALLAVGVLMTGEFYATRAQHVHLEIGLPAQHAKREAEKTEGFPAPSNERTVYADANSQYFNKRIAFQSYDPLVLPAFKRLIDADKGDGRKYFRYVFYPERFPEETTPVPPRAKIETADTEKLSARIQNDRPGPETFMWSSPFSKNWKLKINRRDAILSPAPDGLSSFILPPGESLVELRYAPRYYFFCEILKRCATAVLLLLLFRAARAAAI